MSLIFNEGEPSPEPASSKKLTSSEIDALVFQALESSSLADIEMIFDDVVSAWGHDKGNEDLMSAMHMITEHRKFLKDRESDVSAIQFAERQAHNTRQLIRLSQFPDYDKLSDPVVLDDTLTIMFMEEEFSGNTSQND